MKHKLPRRTDVVAGEVVAIIPDQCGFKISK
jgi:hypothetical protein